VLTGREQLIHLLTEAAELEHNLLCSYLYAAFSLKRPGEPGLSERQADAVERWRKMVLRVALEEMAHLATVNNLLVAIGGAPHFDRANLPLAPGYHPAGLVVRLTPFDRATLDHFIYLERSTGQALGDAPGFDPLPIERAPRRRSVTPSAQDYDTVGSLYDSIAELFEAIAGRLGEAVLIDPKGARQLDSETVKLPNVPAVKTLAAALAAVAWIKEEGEGSSGANQDSHFERFRAIRDEWAEFAAEDPGFEPAWPAAHDPVMRKPAEGVERTWITAEPAAAWLDLGNAAYGAMLQVLSQAFACGEAAEQVRLMKVGVELMEASAALAVALARTPAGEAYPGINAGLTFAVPRNLGFRPTASLRQTLFAERVRELQAGAAAAKLQGETAEKVERRLGAALALLEDAG
jgi:hypothetical protein